mgnify:FL=1
MSQGILRLIGMGTVFALVTVFFALMDTMGQLDVERLNHAATAQERDQWKAAAEEYRKNAEAQENNARQCLDREAKATRDAAERAAIVKRAKPRARTTEEKDKVVDDETRRRAVERLNRPL